MPVTCSSDSHLINVLELLPACRCTVSVSDRLTCGSVINTTAQDHIGPTNHTVEETAGGCADAVPKVNHLVKSSRTDTNVRLASDIQERINRSPTQGNTMILGRLDIRT